MTRPQLHVSYLGEFGQVIECIFLDPSVEAGRRRRDTDEPEENVEAEDQIFDAAADFRPVLTPRPRRRHGLG